MKNYSFTYDFGGYWGQSQVNFTSVIGHLLSQDFDERYRKWFSCDPGELFDSPIRTQVAEDKKAIADNIRDQARRHDVLYIWTDCDREGENIGAEIRSVAFEGNRNIDVKRARFSNIERG